MPRPVEPLEVLFVDDEQVLAGFEALLARRRPPWRLRFAPGARAALRELGRRPADVVVSDLRLPDMDGLGFLAALRESWPSTARVVLDGGPDGLCWSSVALLAHQVLPRPCPPERLRAVIARAERLRTLSSSPPIRAVVGGLQTLPTRPRAIDHIAEVLGRPEASLRAAAAAIQDEPALGAKVLQAANCALLGVSGPIHSLERAVAYLGTRTLADLVIALSALEALAPPTRRGLQELEAVRTATMLVAGHARAICEDHAPDAADAAFLAGMLHDVGRLVIAAGLPPALDEVDALVHAHGVRRDEAERAVLGTSHAEIGGSLLGLWGLPHRVVDAVAHHHEPWRAGPDADIVLVAVHIAAEQAGTNGRPQVDGPLLMARGMRLPGRADVAEGRP
jgi:HD-like signal output (HDOD) protein/CheY-like chemotaxis protein